MFESWLFTGNSFVEVEQDAGDGCPGRVLVAAFFCELLREQLFKALLFGRARISGEAKAEGIVDALRFCFKSAGQDPIGHGFGKFKVSLVVEQGERLQRRIRAETARAGA